MSPRCALNELVGKGKTRRKKCFKSFVCFVLISLVIAARCVLFLCMKQIILLMGIYSKILIDKKVIIYKLLHRKSQFRYDSMIFLRGE